MLLMPRMFVPRECHLTSRVRLYLPTVGPLLLSLLLFPMPPTLVFLPFSHDGIVLVVLLY